MATTNTQAIRLTGTQAAIIAAATVRADASVILPARLKGKAAEKLGQALLAKGLAREVRTKGEQPVWRRDASTGRSFSLVLSKAGRAQGGQADDPGQPRSPGASPDAAATQPGAPTIPREGSKLASVIALLGREGGTSVPELMAATGWLPHTTRAALTGLRKRGYALTREAGEGGPVYRIATAPAAAA